MRNHNIYACLTLPFLQVWRYHICSTISRKFMLINKIHTVSTSEDGTLEDSVPFSLGRTESPLKYWHNPSCGFACFPTTPTYTVLLWFSWMALNLINSQCIVYIKLAMITECSTRQSSHRDTFFSIYLVLKWYQISLDFCIKINDWICILLWIVSFNMNSQIYYWFNFFTLSQIINNLLILKII